MTPTKPSSARPVDLQQKLPDGKQDREESVDVLLQELFGVELDQEMADAGDDHIQSTLGRRTLQETGFEKESGHDDEDGCRLYNKRTKLDQEPLANGALDTERRVNTGEETEAKRKRAKGGEEGLG
jgi:hypothetical protein